MGGFMVRALVADPLWAEAYDKALREATRTGKCALVQAVVEEYCETKGIKVARLDP